ncbi:MAG TPA: hypothetical protein VHW60_00345 [Caulobacteraceae bacterium]|jgi:hypothetical protein|nr:hypothetical protein [Caulobacteraceae bacterium]
MTALPKLDAAPADVRRLRETPALGLVGPSPPALKARQLFDEARAASLEHLQSLGVAIERVRELAAAVVEGGDLYAPGLRELARQLDEDLLWKSRTLQVLSQRQAAHRR